MGSGYNGSLAAGKSARRKATVQTEAHYWLDVPLYVYQLPCGEGHEFRSRTPAISFDGMYVFWCDRCKMFRYVNALNALTWINRSHTTDEQVAFEQDKGIIRERIARFLQHNGLLETEEELAFVAVQYGVPVSEIRRINAGMLGKSSNLPVVDLCRARKHEMTATNIDVVGKWRTCKACRREAQKARRQAKRRSTQGDASSPPSMEGQ